MRIVITSLVIAVLLGSAGVGHAQIRRPRPEIRAVVESDGARNGEPLRVALVVALAEGLHVQSDRPRDPALIPTVLIVDPPPGVVVEETVYPAPIDFRLVGQDEPLAVFEHEFALGVQLRIADSVAAGELVVPARLRYQACDDKLCYPPATAETEWRIRVVASGTPVTRQHGEIFKAIRFGTGKAPSAQDAPAGDPTEVAAARLDDGLAALDAFTMLGSAGGYLGRDDFLRFIRNAENGIVERGWFEGRGPLAIVLLVLFGGLALNLTPCVLPMIPINLAIIGAGAQAGSRRRGLLLGATYGGAMALAYGVLGLVVILTAGTFGTINASPWFNAAIAVSFVVLALAMFDRIAIDFSRFSSRFGGEGAQRGSLALAFTMGTVAALLAGACVAPVVIQVVLFSSGLYTGGTTMALALPFLLGIGMALPWPIAGAGFASLPKPGPWMVRVKQGFGVLIFATAVYYAHVSYTLFANAWVDPAAVSSSVQAKLDAGWQASLSDGLAVAQREGKPVLVDLWATWCKNCLTMDKTTLENADVRSALDGYVKVKFQAEDPDAEPARSMMKRFGAIGLPTYVILSPTSSSSSR